MKSKRAKASAPPSVNVAHSGGMAMAVLFWKDTDATGIQAKCEYLDGIFTVTVSKDSLVKTESFGQSFTPTFGMDIADLSRSGEIAEKLAVEIETELYSN